MISIYGTIVFEDAFSESGNVGDSAKLQFEFPVPRSDVPKPSVNSYEANHAKVNENPADSTAC